MRKLILVLALVVSGCVDADEQDKKNWLRVKLNADRADICIKAGGMPRHNFWTEYVENCLLPIERIK